MSQQAVERAIGKLVTDESFRARFTADPARASLEAGLSLSAPELSALARISDEALHRFAGVLDDSIRRLVAPETASCGRWS
jgi:Ribosomally synthesized peptide prototyped by Frankia Franean1_4349.